MSMRPILPSICLVVPLAVAIALPSYAEDLEATRGRLNYIQAKYDEGIYEMNKAEQAYNAGSYSASCRGYRYAAILLDEAASAAHSAAYDISLSVDRRQLLDGEKEARGLVAMAQENAAEVCAMA